MDGIYKSAEILQFLLSQFKEEFFFNKGNFQFENSINGDFVSPLKVETRIKFSGITTVTIAKDQQNKSFINIFPRILGIKDMFSLHQDMIEEEIKDLTFDPVYDKLSDLGKRIELPSVFESNSKDYNFTLKELHSFILFVKKEMELQNG